MENISLESHGERCLPSIMVTLLKAKREMFDLAPSDSSLSTSNSLPHCMEI